MARKREKEKQIVTKNLLGHFPPPFVQPPTPADVPAKKSFIMMMVIMLMRMLRRRRRIGRDGLVFCVFWKRPLASLAIEELPLQQSQL